MEAGVLGSQKIGFGRRVLFADVERLAHDGTDWPGGPRQGLDALHEQERAAKSGTGTATPARRRRRYMQPEAS
jgi:hypothetical protein